MRPQLTIDPRKRQPTRAVIARRAPPGFTLIELLVVISIIGILASLVVGLAGMAGRKSKESRVRAELNVLITLLEDYRSKMGYYPPDNVVNAATRAVNPVINQLFYELSGTVVTNGGAGGGAFQTPAKDERIDAATVHSVFNRDGFDNAAMTIGEVRYRAKFKKSQYAEISNQPDVEVLVVPVEWPKNDARFPSPVPAKPGLNPWRYVSSNPTNNPGRFDLWAEYILGGKTNIISNWSSETIVLGRK
jgi:prepilin-type N-terminal cleavage/methylation domain-containing protein